MTQEQPARKTEGGIQVEGGVPLKRSPSGLGLWRWNRVSRSEGQLLPRAPEPWEVGLGGTGGHGLSLSQGPLAMPGALLGLHPGNTQAFKKDSLENELKVAGGKGRLGTLGRSWTGCYV